MTAQLASRTLPGMWRSRWYVDKVRVRLDPLPFPFAVLLVLGFALGVEVQFQGLLFAGEILLVMVAVIGVGVNLQNPGFWPRDLYRLAVCLAVSSLAYIFTDIFVGTLENNFLRGWARTGFLITDILGLYVVCRKNRYNLFPLLLGLAVAAILMPHQFTEQGDFAFKWKFDLYFPWISSVCILAAFSGRRRAPVYALLCLISSGAISILLDSRLVGAVCILVAVVLLAQLLTLQRQRKLLLIVLALVVTAGGAATYYLLHHTDQEHAARREGSDVARATALLTALQSVAQHPFLGTGSWNVSEQNMNRHRANTSNLGGKQVAEAMVQGHSQILQAAVEAGLFGAAFFIYFLVCLIDSLWWVVRRPVDRFSAFAMYNLMLCTWNCLFSPQGGSQRIEIATGVCICLLMRKEKRLWQRNLVNGNGTVWCCYPSGNGELEP